MPEYVIYDVTVKTISWVHIGSGDVLLRDYDYAVHEGRTYRLDMDALLDEKVTDAAMADLVARTPPGQLLQAEDFGGESPLFRYILQGEPRSSASGAEVREQIKDAWDRPYLPGSSLKGALRTAILWNAVKQAGRPVSPGDLKRVGRFAAQPVEEQVLRQRGQTRANYDLLRAIQVSDSAPLGIESLVLTNAQVIGGRTQSGAPVELEALRPGAELMVRIKIDLALFSSWARQHGLELVELRPHIENLPATVQPFSRNLAQRGLAWCEHNADRSRLVRFYRQIERDKAPDACFVQIGWGGGWDSKTLGALLQRDPEGFEEMARRYSLRRGRGQVRPGTPFPSTRRMVVTNDNQQVRGPLGWLRLKFERRA